MLQNGQSNNGQNQRSNYKFKGECFHCKKKGHRVADCYVFKQDIEAKRIDPQAYAHMTQRRQPKGQQNQQMPYQQMQYQHSGAQIPQPGTQLFQNPYSTNQFQPPTAGPAPATQVTSMSTQGSGTPLLPTYTVAAMQQNMQSSHTGAATKPSRPSHSASVSFSDQLTQTMPSYLGDASMYLADLMGQPDASNKGNDANN